MRDRKGIIFKRVAKIILAVSVTLVITGTFIFLTQGRDIPVLQTKGPIAHQERDIIVGIFILGLAVVIPVFIMLFTIAWRYRASNTKAKYQPEFASHKGFEALWWGIPCAIIVGLAIFTSIMTHELDPYKELSSSVKPVKIQVVALDWKWLFIYPDEGIATLNYANIPNNTPINLSITSDAPMNSFWVPALAGQVYAMSGMTTQLHLMADNSGSYKGVSSNISGEGFADMRFTINSMNSNEFSSWTKTAMNSQNMLTDDSYNELAKQSSNLPDTTYMLMNKNLYNDIVMKYMPSQSSTTNVPEHGMGM